mgnify:FL=1
MRCEKCKSPHSHVIDSRVRLSNHDIYRRRECAACNNRYSTYEISEQEYTKKHAADKGRAVSLMLLKASLKALESK